ncbi:MAG: hypothetical protein HQ502_07795 [Alphaproteobacteria bacterium]|nr:hypothetical protein [Alphaproteobacteria bacterium]
MARANALDSNTRSEIGKKAANARWAKTKSYTVAHNGSFLEEFGVDVDCYVLDDPMKTAVISQRGMAEAIGFSRRGERLKGFVTTKTMAQYIGRDLQQKIENPIVFQRSKAAAKNEISAKSHGYDVTILIDLCRAILDANADGKLKGARYVNMIQQAQVIMGASAKNGIRQLVYALAGYSPSTDEVISAFKLYVQEEARKYEQEFPNELYEEWHRLYQIPVPVRGKPWHFKHLTLKHIYYPLAESNGKLLTLMRAMKSKDGDRKKKLFQFLNDIGARALRIHLGRVLEMAESSERLEDYEFRVETRFGKQRMLNLITPSSNEPQRPS